MRYLLLIGFLGLIFTFGLDRELARQDYIEAINSNGREVTGCIFSCNCKYFTELLWKSR